MNKTKKETLLMPCVATRGTVMFPNTILHFDLGREKSINAVKAAMDLDRQVLLVCQKDLTVEDPSEKDLYKYGVVSKVKQVLTSGDGITRVLVEGLYRAKASLIDTKGDYILAHTTKAIERTNIKYELDEQEAIIRSLKSTFDRYAKFLPKMPRDIPLRVMSHDNPNTLFEDIAPNIMLHFDQKQELLEINSAYKRLLVLIEMLQHEIEVLAIESDIYSKVKDQMDKNQRDYFLREQQKIIASELGEDSSGDDVYDFVDTIENIINLDEYSREKLLKDCYRLGQMPMQSQEANVLRTYLETCLELPWDKSTKDNLDIKKASAQLERDHYGLKKVKDRILETLAVRALAPDVKGQIICLVGPPGVGKTSIAKSVAKAMNRNYVRVSLGGVKDESEIRGHRKTYVGSMPGRIVNALKQAKSNNPLILLDEIDKMGSDYKGDPSAAMLEVLDGEQNNSFRDHYIEIPVDLSNVFFMTTANSLSTIPTPLLDRMEIIELSSYTREEKFNIAKKYLIPKQLKSNGLKASLLSIKDDATYSIIDNYVKEAGVRGLERSIRTICRKAAKIIVMNEKSKVNVTSNTIEQFLGPKKYVAKASQNADKIGVVSGLAWTSVGGEMLEIEVAIMHGTGKLKLTGSLGDVMKESADIALSYVRTISDAYNITPDFYKTCDIHIHAPEGAVPKDGPSAGVTMVTAIVSALTGTPVRGDVAMTGEVSLRGDVLPIGGLKEKSMAAYKEGKITVIIPMGNKADISQFDDVIKENINFIPVESVDEVLSIALADNSNLNEQNNFQWVIEPDSSKAEVTTIKC